MATYRGYTIDTEFHERLGFDRYVITSPDGRDSWYHDGDPEAEIDSLLEETESPEETLERHEDWRLRQWELA